MSERTKVLTRAGGFIGLQGADAGAGGTILISARQAGILYSDTRVNPYNLETASSCGGPPPGRSRSEN